MHLHVRTCGCRRHCGSKALRVPSLGTRGSSTPPPPALRLTVLRVSICNAAPDALARAHLRLTQRCRHSRATSIAAARPSECQALAAEVARPLRRLHCVAQSAERRSVTRTLMHLRVRTCSYRSVAGTIAPRAWQLRCACSVGPRHLGYLDPFVEGTASHSHRAMVCDAHSDALGVRTCGSKALGMPSLGTRGSSTPPPPAPRLTVRRVSICDAHPHALGRAHLRYRRHCGSKALGVPGLGTQNSSTPPLPALRLTIRRVSICNADPDALARAHLRLPQRCRHYRATSISAARPSDCQAFAAEVA